jgi:uncharacterized protein DUF6314
VTASRLVGQTGSVPAAAPDALIGRWTLRRRLHDRSAGIVATMAGTLTIAQDAGGLDWSEAGVLRWLGRDVEVTRRYLLRERTDGWWVLFDDGRPFHPWRPGQAVEHPCRADLYRGLISPLHAGRWRVLWDVTGPGKQQRIVSRLQR